jgi:hypothetical protein
MMQMRQKTLNSIFLFASFNSFLLHKITDYTIGSDGGKEKIKTLFLSAIYRHNIEVD